MAETAGIRLIAGLGNPGPRYAQTRHNAGFWFVDALTHACCARLSLESKFSGEAGRVTIEDHEVWLFKPGAFMNRSGGALRAISAFYKIPLFNVLVVHDEIDLPPGTAKLKRGGGHGGHNGLRDIFAHLGTDFWRLRLGVGHPGDKHRVVDYLTSEVPSAPERQEIIEGVQRALAIVPMLLAGDFEQAMHRLHSS